MTGSSSNPQPETMLEPLFIEDDQDSTSHPISLTREDAFWVGCEAELSCDISDDQQLMGLLAEPTREAIEYGDPDSRQNGIQKLAEATVRQLGLPACLGKFIDLDNDQIARRAIKMELTRQEARGKQTSYANQDMNAWAASLGRVEPLVRSRLSSEQNEQLNNELGIWAEEMKEKAMRISRGLSRLREH